VGVRASERIRGVAPPGSGSRLTIAAHDAADGRDIAMGEPDSSISESVMRTAGKGDPGRGLITDR